MFYYKWPSWLIDFGWANIPNRSRQRDLPGNSGPSLRLLQKRLTLRKSARSFIFNRHIMDNNCSSRLFGNHAILRGMNFYKIIVYLVTKVTSDQFYARFSVWETYKITRNKINVLLCVCASRWTSACAFPCLSPQLRISDVRIFQTESLICSELAFTQVTISASHSSLIAQLFHKITGVKYILLAYILHLHQCFISKFPISLKYEQFQIWKKSTEFLDSPWRKYTLNLTFC